MERVRFRRGARRSSLPVGADTTAPTGAATPDPEVLKPYGRRVYYSVLEATIDEMGRNGFEATPVARILEVSGSSRGFFYKHFGSRESAFFAAYGTATGRMAAAVASSVDGKAEWRERVWTAVDALLGAASRRPALIRFLLIEPVVVGPRAVIVQREQLARLVVLLDEGRDEVPGGGELPAHAGNVAIGSALTLLVGQWRANKGARLEKLAPEIYSLLLMPYLGPAGAAAAVRGSFG